ARGAAGAAVAGLARGRGRCRAGCVSRRARSCRKFSRRIVAVDVAGGDHDQPLPKRTTALNTLAQSSGLVWSAKHGAVGGGADSGRRSSSPRARQRVCTAGEGTRGGLAVLPRAIFG